MKSGVIAAMAAMALSSAVWAGPVYKCTVKGKTSYSDEPCVGAKEIDTTPTEGMNKWTGTEQKSAELRASQHRDRMAEILKPVTGMTPEESEKLSRRMNLPPEHQRECRSLDSQIAALKAQAPTDEQSIYTARVRFFKLKC